MAIRKQIINGKETVYVDGVEVVGKDDLNEMKKAALVVVDEYNKVSERLEREYPTLCASFRVLWASLSGFTIPPPPKR